MYCRRLYKEADGVTQTRLSNKNPECNNQEVYKVTARHSPRRSPKKCKFSESNSYKCFFPVVAIKHTKTQNCHTIGHFCKVCQKPRLSPKISQAAQVKYI